MSIDPARRPASSSPPRVLVVGDLLLERSIQGSAERLFPSSGAPLPRLRVNRRDVQAGGAARLAQIASRLGAQASLLGVLGRDPEACMLRSLLAEHAIDDSLVLNANDRPTPIVERYFAQAAHRESEPLIEVEISPDAPIPSSIERALEARLPDVVRANDLVFVVDQGVGVCTSKLIRRLIAVCRSLDVRVVVSSHSGSELEKFQWAHYLALDHLQVTTALASFAEWPEPEPALGPAQGPTPNLEARARLVDALNLAALIETHEQGEMALLPAQGDPLLFPPRSHFALGPTSSTHDLSLTRFGLALAAGLDLEESARLAHASASNEAHGPLLPIPPARSASLQIPSSSSVHQAEPTPPVPVSQSLGSMARHPG